jgi:hypothetical protein
MKKNERFEMIRRIKLNLSEVKPNKMEEGDMENPCWEGYEPYGTKVGDDGREVPNCVPVEAKKVKQGFPIPSPSGDEDENAYMSRCMSEIGGEYDQDQALAICYKKYQEK